MQRFVTVGTIIVFLCACGLAVADTVGFTADGGPALGSSFIGEAGSGGGGGLFDDFGAAEGIGGGELPPIQPPPELPVRPPQFLSPPEDTPQDPIGGEAPGETNPPLPGGPRLSDLIGTGGELPTGENPPAPGSSPGAQAVPLPLAAWGGLALLGAVGIHHARRQVRRDDVS